jgi:hypothetical protein
LHDNKLANKLGLKDGSAVFYSLRKAKGNKATKVVAGPKGSQDKAVHGLPLPYLCFNCSVLLAGLKMEPPFKSFVARGR